MQYIPAKTIVTKTKNSSWFGTDYNMNIYKGCCHGCIYCDSRSECYHVENFDTVRAKENAIQIIQDELRRKVKTGVIGTGSMSDPYNPFEKEQELTRNALKLIDSYGFGVAIATKSSLITRDIDILQAISLHSPAICKITITTCDDELCKRIEPNVSLSSERFEAIRQLREANIYAGILFMPVLPFITDTEENVLKLVHLAKENGAKFIYPAFGLTLRTNQRDYYYQQLDRLFPNLKVKYQRLYGDQYACGSPNAKALYSIFTKECEKYGILYKMQDIVADYQKKYQQTQISFF